MILQYLDVISRQSCIQKLAGVKDECPRSSKSSLSALSWCIHIAAALTCISLPWMFTAGPIWTTWYAVGDFNLQPCVILDQIVICLWPHHPVRKNPISDRGKEFLSALFMLRGYRNVGTHKGSHPKSPNLETGAALQAASEKCVCVCVCECVFS